MSASFQFTPQATEDLDEIWWFMAQDSVEAANRVEAEVVATCHRLARYPLIGKKRPDITPLPVRFWTVARYPNYIIVYKPETARWLQLPFCMVSGTSGQFSKSGYSKAATTSSNRCRFSNSSSVSNTLSACSYRSRGISMPPSQHPSV